MTERTLGHEVPKPNINLNFFISHQMKAEDAWSLSERIAAHDVVGMAIHGWNDKSFFVLQALTQGRFTPAQCLNPHNPRSGFAEVVYEALYNTSKPILLVDVPQREPLSQEINQAQSAINQIPLSQDYDGNFEALVRRMDTALEKLSILQDYREQYVLNIINIYLGKTLFIAYPELAKKDKIDMLIIVDPELTFLFKRCIKEEIKAKISINNLPIETYATEASRKYRSADKPDDKLIARALLETTIYSIAGNELAKHFTSSQDLIEYVRQIVGMFDYREIEDLYGLYHRYDSAQRQLNYLILQQIKEKRIPPQSLEISFKSLYTFKS